MSSTEQHGRPVGVVPLTMAVLLVLAGLATLTVAVRAQRHAPQPPASAAVAYQPKATGPGRRTPRPALPRSVPLRLDIPAIGVATSLLQLGLNPDRSIEVPPLSRHAPAGWYRYSPTPGQLGPAVILGHVDSAAYGPGVFFNLGALRPGAALAITRTDHSTAIFRVDRVVSYPKNGFPTREVYGNTDHAALRLITCGGTYDGRSHTYRNNIIAYASLISRR